MKTYSFDNGYGTTYTFEIVDRIPKGYHIWHIPEEDMLEGLVPLCQCYEGTYDVITPTLKAIYIEDKAIRKLLIRETFRGIKRRTESAKKAREILKSLSE